MVQQTHTLDVNDSKALNQLLQREKHITNIIRLDFFGLLFVAHGIFSFIPQLLIVVVVAAVIVISHISLVEHTMYVLCECFEFFLLLPFFFFLFFSGMILHLCFCIFCYYSIQQYTEFNHLFEANSFFLSSFYSRSKS